jgi:hypothetical protein
VWMRPVTNIKSGNDYILYRSTSAASTLIVLFSEMFEFSKEIKFQKEQIMKENKEFFEFFWDILFDTESSRIIFWG